MESLWFETTKVVELTVWSKDYQNSIFFVLLHSDRLNWYYFFSYIYFFQERIEIVSQVEIDIQPQHEDSPEQPIEHLQHQPIEHPQQQPIEHPLHQPIEYLQVTMSSLSDWKSSACKSFVSLAEFVAARGISCWAFLVLVTFIIGLLIDTQSMILAEMRLASLIPLLWIRQSSELTDYVLKKGTNFCQYILDLV